jgi:hypothetical protein
VACILLSHSADALLCCAALAASSASASSALTSAGSCSAAGRRRWAAGGWGGGAGLGSGWRSSSSRRPAALGASSDRWRALNTAHLELAAGGAVLAVAPERAGAQLEQRAAHLRRAVAGACFGGAGARAGLPRRPCARPRTSSWPALAATCSGVSLSRLAASGLQPSAARPASSGAGAGAPASWCSLVLPAASSAWPLQASAVPQRGRGKAAARGAGLCAPSQGLPAARAAAPPTRLVALQPRQRGQRQPRLQQLAERQAQRLHAALAQLPERLQHRGGVASAAARLAAGVESARRRTCCAAASSPPAAAALNCLVASAAVAIGRSALYHMQCGVLGRRLPAAGADWSRLFCGLSSSAGRRAGAGV